MRSLAWLTALVLLGGCNVVVTQKPLFTAADEAGAPVLKPGLWRMSGLEDCKVDETRPLIAWPNCAGGVVLKAGAADFYDRNSGTPVLSHQPVVLAAGDPRIGQTQLVISGDVKANANPYGYAGVRPTARDGEGRITAFAFWPVQCGPPPPGGDGVTKQPLPGIEMKPDDPVCTTTSREALRGAARLSEAWTPKPLVGRWVRDAP